VRHIALVLICLTATAHADDGEDEDAYFASFPKLALAAGMTGHGGHVDGRPEDGMAGVLELDYGRGRWQYLLDGELGTSNVQRTMTTPVAGTRSRGAVGMRWLARQFIPFDPLGIELYLRGTAGVEHFHWTDGQQSRPDLSLGLSFAARAFRRPNLFARFDLDLVFASGDTGIAAGMVVGW
jgi:hypothetical protein